MPHLHEHGLTNFTVCLISYALLNVLLNVCYQLAIYIAENPVPSSHILPIVISCYYTLHSHVKQLTSRVHVAR